MPTPEIVAILDDVEIMARRNYRGFAILTMKQSSGRKTYDIVDATGQVDSVGHYSVAVAKAEIDAELEGR